MASLSRHGALSVLSFGFLGGMIIICAYIPQFLSHIIAVLQLPGLLPTIFLAILAPFATYKVVGACKDSFLAKGFGGRDLLKTQSVAKIPEGLGLPTSIIYCLLMCCFIPFRYGSHTDSKELRTNADGGWNGVMQGRSGFPHHELSTYLSSLLSLLASILLGFLDDVFDIRWRLKMPIPILASLPMLVVYHAGQGGTSVVVPGWPPILRQALQSKIIDLGPAYHVFILLLSTFCVHSINIYAGINGVEVGQALIIALSICCNDVLYLDPKAGEPGSFASLELRERHMFSLALLLPFCGCCIGLLIWNKFPARVFVGDTFCYFAGQVLACAGVLGHFSKTLLLFFVPQLINFGLSLPQLLGWVPCPRHRVPDVSTDSTALFPSRAFFSEERPPTKLTAFILRLFEAFHLAHLEWDESHTRLVSTTNLTLLNAFLVFRGVTPIPHKGTTKTSKHKLLPVLVTEKALWWHAIIFQMVCSTIAFAVRYWLAAVVFP